MIDDADSIRRAQAIFDMLQVQVDPTALVGDLGAGQKQLTEIAKAISQKELDDSVSAEQVADAEVKSVRARVSEARLNLSYTQVEAPISGTLKILVPEGEEVAIGTLIARITATGEVPAAVPVAPGSAPLAAAQASGSVELKVPASGESITSANVAAWRRNDGDSVVKGEVLVVLDRKSVV